MERMTVSPRLINRLELAAGLTWIVGRFCCPVPNCSHHYAHLFKLYQHCRERSDDLHKSVPPAGPGMCSSCQKTFARPYFWSRHYCDRNKVVRDRRRPYGQMCTYIPLSPSLDGCITPGKGSEHDLDIYTILAVSFLAERVWRMSDLLTAPDTADLYAYVLCALDV